MTDLSLHIEYLLQHHDCVILPGLGAFVAVCTPALFDAERDIIAPPQRGVQFNPAISSDDGLLASSYARRYSLNYTAARERMMKDVDLMRRKLEEGLTLRVGNIGSLTRGEEERILFTPRLRADILADSLGCHIINLAPARDDADSCDAAEAVSADGGALAAAEDTPLAGSPADSAASRTADRTGASGRELTVPTIFGRRRVSDKNIYVAVNRQFAGVAAIALVVVAFASAFLIPPYARRTHVEASMVPVEKILCLHSFGSSDAVESSDHSGARTSARTSAKAYTLPASQDHDRAQGHAGTAARPSSEDEAISAAAAGSDRGYHLIVATFHSEKDAAGYIASAPSDVASRLRVVTQGRTSRVSLASSSDRAALLPELNRVQDQFPGAWIWEKK